MLIYRIHVTGNIRYVFLIWNLFLAVTPLLSAWLCKKYYQKGYHIIGFHLLIMWLLLFPNAPYIITDFIHLRVNKDIPLWFDAILLLQFSIAGFLSGILSLYWIHLGIKSIYGNIISQTVVYISIILCGYGVYLGRFVRLNTWDIITKTEYALLATLKNVVHSEAIMMTLVFSVITLIGYKTLIQSDTENVINENNHG